MKYITLNQVTGEGDTGEDDVVQELTLPYQVMNPAENIRTIAARKYGRRGSRITFIHGGAVAVVETVEEINTAMQGLYN